VVDDPQGNTGIQGIGFVDRDRGWVGGWGPAKAASTSAFGPSSSTTDGGKTWQDAPEVGSNINRFRFLHDGDRVVGYAAGYTIYKYTSAAERETVVTPPDPTTSLFTTPHHERIVGHGAVDFTVNVGPGACDVEVVIEDPDRGPVRILHQQRGAPPGPLSLSWNGKDDQGTPRPECLHVVHVKVGERREARLMVLKRST
jgi:hypothetical protein